MGLARENLLGLFPGGAAQIRYHVALISGGGLPRWRLCFKSSKQGQAELTVIVGQKYLLGFPFCPMKCLLLKPRDWVNFQILFYLIRIYTTWYHQIPGSIKFFSRLPLLLLPRWPDFSVGAALTAKRSANKNTSKQYRIHIIAAGIRRARPTKRACCFCLGLRVTQLVYAL